MHSAGPSVNTDTDTDMDCQALFQGSYAWSHTMQEFDCDKF